MATTTTTLANLLPQIVAEATFVAQERSIMRNLVKNYSIPMNSGKTLKVPVYPKQTAAALSEGTAVNLTNVSANSATITLGEVGIAALVTDFARDSAAADVIADVGRMFGEAIAVKIDTDLTALFSSFTTAIGNVLAPAGNLVAADIFEAQARLRAAGVPPTDLFCVVHPLVAYDLKSSLTNVYANPNSGILQNEAMQMGYIGMLAGIPLFETSSMTPVGGSGDDFVGAVFHRDALGLAIMRDINIEVQRNALSRGDELVATATYGVAEIVDSYGVAIARASSLA
jgi:N4-gp56 family major capsid protein